MLISQAAGTTEAYVRAATKRRLTRPQTYACTLCRQRRHHGLPGGPHTQQVSHAKILGSKASHLQSSHELNELFDKTRTERHMLGEFRRGRRGSTGTRPHEGPMALGLTPPGHTTAVMAPPSMKFPWYGRSPSTNA